MSLSHRLISAFAALLLCAAASAQAPFSVRPPAITP